MARWAWLWVLLGMIAPAAGGLELDPRELERGRSIAPELEMFVDRDGAFTLSELLGEHRQAPWQPLADLTPLPRYDTAFYWFRLPVTNPRGETLQLLLVYAHPRQDILNVYQVHAGRVIRRFETGSLRPFASRPINHHHFLFPLDVGPAERHELLIQAQSRPSYIPAATFLWERENFLVQQPRAEVWQWFFLGVLSAIALYHLMVFGLTRDTPYLLYTFYIAANLWLFLATYGQGVRYLWPQSPHLDQLLPHVLPPLIGICINLFTVSFLNLRDRLPWMARLFVALSLLWGALLALRLLLEGPAGHFTHLVESLFRVGLLLSLLTSVYLWWQDGDRNARNYSIAWASFLLATPLALLSPDLTPAGRDLGYQIGLLIHVILFAVVLATRINMLGQERRQAEAERRALAAVLPRIGGTIRSPLHAILGMSELLRRAPQTPADLTPLQVIDRAAGRLLNETDDLIDATALDAGHFQAVSTRFDLQELLRDVIARQRRTVPPQVAATAWASPSLPGQFEGDAQRLPRLLDHLLAAARPANGQRLLLVADSGEQEHSLRFEVRNARATRDGHPGLALAARMAGEAGGRAGFSARTGKGPGLWLELPARPLVAAPGPIAPAAVPPRVLVVSADTGLREACLACLQHAGMLPLAAASGREALDLVAASQQGDARFDWLICPRQLPDASARELLAAIRRRWPTTALCGLVLDAQTQTQDPRDRSIALPCLLNDLPRVLLDAGGEESLETVPAHRLRVAIADGSDDNLSTWSAMLADLNCETTLFSQGRELLHHYRRGRRGATEPLDAILLDTRLTDPPAEALARALRQFEQHKKTPRVLLLAATPEADAHGHRQLLLAGFDAILVKPASLDQLAKVLRAGTADLQHAPAR